ncbi:extracellular calcium-sensing receptor [Xenopus tropicalis]|uniref:Extracellular calcium-sensing receptor n=1 Tax=Xenopus tropicalis TaxID=8364 RepID=A0A8J0SK26_XENTR|nr:extracellular calcium-sensing receptor [Xenopus tropicalis]|eukprot:XP_012815733.1 PREDICTED: extracellular calcium-sensing receptor-like [Xenopus tropicalis]
MGPQGILVPGDLLIGGVVPIHVAKLYPTVTFHEMPPADICTMFENYQQLQAMRYAVEEINQRSDLLPNITLGFYAYDSCAALQSEIKGTLWMLTGKTEEVPNYCCRKSPPLAAIIGHSKSTYSMLMAHILGLYKVPQISYFSTSSLLSDRTQFSSFFRTVPSDVFQSRGLAHLVLHFNWTWVGLIASNDDYGYKGLEVIKQEITKGGACVAYIIYMSRNPMDQNIHNIVQVIKESSARVLVAFCTDVYLIPVLDEMLKQNVTGKSFIASEAWSISNVLSVPKYSSLLSGTIGFAFHSSTIPGFQRFLNSINPLNTPGTMWSKFFWEEAFGCTFSNQTNSSDIVNALENPCTGDEDLENLQNSYNDVSNLRASYNIYTAVYVIAKALDDLNHCQTLAGPLFNKYCATLENFEPWQLLHYLKKVRVKLSNGREVYFDEDGNPPAVYDIVNWHPGSDGSLRQVKVGRYDTMDTSRNVFSINISAIWWPSGNEEIPLSVCGQSCPEGFRKAARRGEPVCCFECVPCAQGEISNQTDSIECWKCPWDMWPNSKRDRCFPKPIEFLSYDDSLGITLAAISVFSCVVPLAIFRLFIHYKSTPIVRANNHLVSCVLLVSLSFCFLCALAFIGYPQPEKCLLRQAAFGLVFTLCVSCILAKTIIVVFAFMATKPGSSLKKWTTPRVPYMIITICTFIQLTLCVIWLTISPPFPQYNSEAKPGIIFVECDENSPYAFWCMLGYLGFLASVSFTVAFLARRLPDNFNEAKLITFSMLAFLSVWVYFIPASLSAQGKYTVAMEIFAILTSTWALVICMFLPKCFVILFRPNMNSKENLMGKDRRKEIKKKIIF